MLDVTWKWEHGDLLLPEVLPTPTRQAEAERRQQQEHELVSAALECSSDGHHGVVMRRHIYGHMHLCPRPKT